MIQEKEWVDKVIDLNKAVEILREHHPEGNLTLLKPMEINNDDPDNISVAIDPAIVEINKYLIGKYGEEEWLIIVKQVMRELFFKHLDAIN